VAALLATNPTTPTECARAAKILVDLHQPERAKELLKKIVDANLDQNQLAALGREIGSVAFLGFARIEELQPQGKQLSDAVLEAMNAESHNTEKIAAAIKQLQDPSIEKRTKALEELQRGRKAAVAALIEVLADPNREAEFKNVRAALASMGRSAFNQMIGIMGNADPKLKEQAILVLGDAVAIDAKYFLLAPALEQADGDENGTAVSAAARQALARLTNGHLPSKSEATKLLIKAANLYLNRQPPLPDAVDGKVEIWRWDSEQRKCVISSLPIEDARLVTAARLAHDALALAPENTEAKLLYWTATLEAAAYQNGLDKRIDTSSNPSFADLEKQTNLQFIVALLDYAVSGKHYPAAANAAAMLGRIGTAGELLYPLTGQSVLVRAIEQPDRRLRIAAIEAIVKLKPEKQYPGSSNVLQALAYFATGSGTPRALVAGPNLNNIPRLVPALSAAGFRIDTAQTGKQVLEKLLASPDYEIAMIDAGISQPSVDLLLQQIRRDNRSADVRIGIIARAGFFDKAEHVTGSDPLTLDFPRPNDDDAASSEVAHLAALKPRDLVRPEERLRQAGEALDLLAELSRTSKLYDIRRMQDSVLTALKTPALAAKAVAVLANINSLEAQQALVATASSDSSPMELRQATVEAFRANVHAYGVLLSPEEVRRQYDIYNKSEKADKATQQVLALILDCLEAAKK
jgi:CheY-like chemotaxis protein